MVGMLAIAAAGGWLLAFSLCAVVTRLPPRWASAAAPWPGLDGERPALASGIGDGAWLINRHHTVVFRVGNHTGKVTVSGAASCALPPDVLPRLATVIVGRLTGPDARLTGPDNGLTGPDNGLTGPDARLTDSADRSG
jgi:hypothetical protein